MRIRCEGPVQKFVEQVSHVTFSGERARSTGQTVHSITERRVLRLGDRGLKLTETASDLGLARRVGGDGLPAAVSTDLREMDAAIFTGQPLGRRDHQATRICR